MVVDMSWSVTEDAVEFLAEAGDFLGSSPAEHTVVLTVAERVRDRGSAAFGGAVTVFGWYRPNGSRGPVVGAFIHTLGFPVHLSAAPSEAIGPLVDYLHSTGRSRAELSADVRTAAELAAAWRDRTGIPLDAHDRDRLYRLGELTPPEPVPAGELWAATATERHLLVDWHQAFNAETGGGSASTAARVDDRLSHGGLFLWNVDGMPVCMVGVSSTIAAMARIGPVYTPTEHRGHGYAAALTATVSQAARDAGATTVVLFADLANPTSNRLYQRLGYVPVADRVLLAAGAPTAP